MSGDTLGPAIDSLYRLPLGDFTTERNALAKRLRAEGDREGADRVKALRKPPVTAWAVNQVVHHYPELWADVLEATDTIRRAHASGPERLSEAAESRKRAIAAGAEAAAGVLKRAGHPHGPAQLRRVTASLEALSSGDPETLAGRLTSDLEPPGFEGLAGLEFASVPRRASGKDTAPPAKDARSARTGPAPSRSGARPSPEPAGSARSAARDAVRQAETELERLEATLADAASDLTEAKRQRDMAGEASNVARAALAAAQLRVTEAASAEASLSRRLEKLGAEHTRAERSVERARATLEAKRAALNEA